MQVALIEEKFKRINLMRPQIMLSSNINHNSHGTTYTAVVRDENLSLLPTLKRDSITILADILGAMSASKPSKKMSLVYKANLNFERIGKYLYLLAAAGLIEKMTTNESVSYRITTKGRQFLIEYSHLIDSLKASAGMYSKEDFELVSPT